MQVSMLVNTMLYFNKRYLHIFNHPRLYPSIIHFCMKLPHCYIGITRYIHMELVPTRRTDSHMHSPSCSVVVVVVGPGLVIVQVTIERLTKKESTPWVST